MKQPNKATKKSTTSKATQKSRGLTQFYYVQLNEIHQQTYRVLATSPDKARQKAIDGDGAEAVNDCEYIRSDDIDLNEHPPTYTIDEDGSYKWCK